MKREKGYLTANEVAEILGVSVGHAYKLIQRMNKELDSKGFMFVAGKVPVSYFEERFYGFTVPA